jgi:hypothetical protein
MDCDWAERASSCHGLPNQAKAARSRTLVESHSPRRPFWLFRWLSERNVSGPSGLPRPSVIKLRYLPYQGYRLIHTYPDYRLDNST